MLTISPSRWRWAVGMDVLLLAMLWWEYTQSFATPLALGWGLAVFASMKAWLYVVRTLWLRWKVRKVFGRSIDHLQVPVLPLAYRLTIMVGDVLITAMLAGTVLRAGCRRGSSVAPPASSLFTPLRLARDA